MKIRLLAICKNEEEIMPFFMQHYLPWVDEIVIADGNSTDNSIKIAQEMGGNKTRILNFDKGDELDDITLMHIRNNSWKTGCSDYDWQIVVDMDEFIYHPDILGILHSFQQENISLPTIKGYEMYSKSFPTFGIPLCKQVTRGYYNPQWLTKQVIFNPKLTEIEYAMGCHSFNANGIQKISNEALLLLHYKNLGFDYVTRRSKYADSRLSKRNRDNNLGYHYKHLAALTLDQFNEKYMQTTNILKPDRSYLQAQDEFVYNEMFNWNVYRVEEADVKDRHVLDVGGQYGLFTTLVYDHGAKNIIAVEANPRNYAKYLRNTKTFQNVKAINAAITKETGNIITVDDNGGGSKTGQGDMTVSTITLEDVVSMFPDNEDIVLKMDIEGAEYEALYSTSSKVLRRFDKIFIEIHGPLHEGGGGGKNNTVKELEAFIVNHGFTIAWIGSYYTDYTDGRGRVPAPDVFVYKFLRT